MPVYWLALSQTTHIDQGHAFLVFIIFHLLVYPASNGYNSYMDRDTGSIGGIKNPMQPTVQLFYITILLDIVAVLCSCYLSPWLVSAVLLYILASRAYSYRGIRLKRFPITGYLTVIIFQGALVFFAVMHGSSASKTLEVPLIGMVAAALLVGGFYPLTQIYQHMEDRADGVTTLSYKLGYRGTFVFTAIVYALAMVTLGTYLALNLQLNHFFIIQVFLLPVLAYFFWWFYKVYHNSNEANFKNTMGMNLVASFFTNAAFIFLFIMEKF